MVYQYVPKGVCSRVFEIELTEGIVRNVKITGGCDGNAQGVSSLLKGMPAKEAIERLRGISCNGRGTSCPDQISLALMHGLSEIEKEAEKS